MMEDMMITSGDVKSKRASLAPRLFLIIAAMITLMLAYAVIVPNALATIRSFSFSDQRGGDPQNETRKRILAWMAENSAMPEPVLAKIYKAASDTGNRDLILAICLVESNFNPHAESDKGAIGLMGIMPGVWVNELKAQGIIREREDLYKISGNIAAGAHVIETYLSETNDLRQALIRYVGGASWYATRVFRAQQQIRLAQSAGLQLASSIVQD